MDDLGSFRDSWNDFHGDSCGFSECVPAVSSGVPVVTDVSDSFLWWLCLVKLCCRALIVRLWFSLSRKCQAFGVEKSRRPPVKAPPNEDYAAHTTAEPAAVN